MTSDRELLELAAKASGLLELALHDKDMQRVYQRWNPLTDDGDALRLAVKLELRIETPYVNTYHNLLTRPLVQSQNLKHSVCCNEGNSEINDPYAATRRAITRAAAEIGRSM